jgi:putative transposase
VVRLATSLALCPGRHRRPLAARTVPQILGQVVQPAAPASRSSRHSRRTPPIDRANGHANPLWRAPRIHGELQLLSIAISERTVSRILRRLRRPPNQTWRTFLHNHVGQLVSIDFFTVPTISMRVLFVFILLEHDRRKVLHFNVTEHPTGAWTAQQIVEASQTERPPSISSAIATAGTVLKFDCESSRWASRRFSQHREVPGRIHTASDSSARFEGCLNHYIVLNARHLKRTLSSYFRYYHESRTHLSLAKQCPFLQEALSVGKLVTIPQLGGLHHRYERIAA